MAISNTLRADVVDERASVLGVSGVHTSGANLGREACDCIVNGRLSQLLYSLDTFRACAYAYPLF